MVSLFEIYKMNITVKEELLKKNNNKEIEIDPQTVPLLNSEVTEWKTVESYYKKECKATVGFNTTTLYHVFHNGLAKLMMNLKSKISGGGVLLNKYVNYKQIKPIIETAYNVLPTLNKAHDYNTYKIAINNVEILDNAEIIRKDGFKLTTFEQANDYIKGKTKDAVSTFELLSNYTIALSNPTEQSQLLTFANTGTNAEKLGWDINDVSTWTGIQTDENGNVTSIELPYLELTGSLDLSNFSQLSSLNIVGNRIESINLTNCTNLANLNISNNLITELELSDCTNLNTLDCSYNELTALNLINNSQITTLDCTNCNLSTLNLGNLTELTELYCSFNKLTSLDITANASLAYLSCEYNYLDIQDNSPQLTVNLYSSVQLGIVLRLA